MDKNLTKEHYHLHLFDDGTSVITKDIWSTIEECIDSKTFLLDWKKKFRIKVGDKVINPWGNIETIKQIIYHEETQTRNYLVEENNNCYLPRELLGVFIKYLDKEQTDSIIK